MKEELLAKLEDDRKVLYEGTAQNVRAMDKTHARTNLIRIIAIMGVCALLVILYCVKVETTKLGIIALLVIICAYAACAEVLHCGKFKKVKYYITEKHIVTDFDTSDSVVPFDSIKNYEFKTDDDGQNYLVCGDVKKGMYGLRSIAVTPARVNDGVCTEYVTYAMSDFDKFKAVFEQQMKKS